MANVTADAVVVGAGVIGCSVGYALARAGWSVVIVDRLGAPGQGSTSSSSAIIRFNYSTHAGVATSWEAHHAWLDWREHLAAPAREPVARFLRTGALTLDSPSHEPGKVLALFDRIGVPYLVWDPAQLRAALPVIDPARYYPPKPVDSEEFWLDGDGELGGYFTPDAGFVDDPGFAAQNLAAAAQRRGARFRPHATVTAVTTGGGRVSGIDLAGGDHLAAPVVVNVAGPASGKLNALAGLDDDFAVHTRPLRTEVHTVPAPAGFDDGGGPGPLVADLDLGSYFRGTPSGELLVGGVEPECDPMHWLADADIYDLAPTEEVYRAQLYRAARRMPTLTVPNRPVGIAAVYDVADDWIPIYDRTALPGFYVAIGTSGNQFKNAPLVGDYLHAIIDACENGRDHDVTPVSHHLPISGQRVELSAYSRRRERTAASSNTVMG